MQAIKPVLEVQFEEVDRPVLGVGMSNAVEQSVEGSPKLHGFLGSERQGVLVDSPLGVVGQEPVLPIQFFLHVSWGPPEAREISDFGVGKHCPIATLHKLSHLVGDESRVFLSGGMTSFLDGCVQFLLGPWWVVKCHRHSVLFQAGQEGARRMREVLEIRPQMRRAMFLLDEGFPIRGGMQASYSVID